MAGRSDVGGGLLGRLKSAVVQRVIGVVVLVLTTAIVGAVRMGLVSLNGGSASQEESALVQTPSEPAAKDMKVTATPLASKDDGVDLDQPAVDDAEPVATATPGPAKPAARTATRLASTTATNAAMVTAVTPTTPKAARATAQFDEHVTYQYNALGRRDPFTSLVGGDFVGVDVGGDAPPDPGGIKIVGIVWGASDQFAMVEDVRGNSYVLRKGDKLQNGVVDALRRDALVVSVTADGQSQQVVIPFVRKGEGQ